MYSPELKRGRRITSVLAFLLAMAPLIYAQRPEAGPPSPPPPQPTVEAPTWPLDLISAAVPSDGSLGEFYPRQEVILDSRHPFWNGKPVLLDKSARTQEVIGGIFNFSRIHIPAGVTVRFKGYKYVVLNAQEQAVINGSIDMSGENGINGTNGENGPFGIGGDGGDGGAGGFGDPGMGNGGAGGGGGFSFILEGRFGVDGPGPPSPGRPGFSCSHNCNIYGGCGAAGGGNGTRGAAGGGPGGPEGGATFGDLLISENPRPAGGGGFSWGGCGWRCDNVESTFCGGGGGGGSGGAGGTLIIRGPDGISLGGLIRTNGGPGGHGGGGGVMTWACLPISPTWGCNGGGGGGGGAGGFILLESEDSIVISGRLEASGGLGGVRGLGPPPNNRHGFDGGAGGGGRIAAFAPRITGITASNGSQASGRTTPGQPTVVQAGVEIINADVTTDRIEIRLFPGNFSGNLHLELTGPNTHVIRQVFRSGGTYQETFNIPGLAVGEYTQVRARWTISNRTITATYPYHIRVLGPYRHSQYNIPNENQCTGSDASAYITNARCEFDPTTLRSQFVSQVNLNGTGFALSYGYVRREVFCLNQPQAPPDAPGRSFRAVDSIDGACNSGLDNNTVARRPGHPYLNCGDTVYIHSVGIKTVTDLCPGCPNTQLDNFTTDERCANIVDLGNFMTIKLF